MKSFKFYIPLMILVLLSACSDRYKIKNKIDGKYTITNYESRYTNYFQCNGLSDLVPYSIDNPGKLVFTGKKVIDGTSTSPSERPYYGYFEYEYDPSNYLSTPIAGPGKKDVKKYFQYDVLETTGSVDSVGVWIYIDQVKYDLSYELDGNKITKFKYSTFSGCYKIEETHTVK